MPRPTKMVKIRNGLNGVTDTIKIMGALIKQGAQNITIRQKALSILAGVRQYDYSGEAAALHAFVRDQIRYTRDPYLVETIAEPWVTLELKQGDCDDKTVLLGALMSSVGFPVRVVAVGFAPRQCSHVLLQADISGQWVSAETTQQVPLGWFPSGVQTTKIFEVR